MSKKRKVEIFSAGCPICQDTIDMVKNLSCPSCDVQVLDMKTSEISDYAKKLGICSIPSVVIDGKPADCCRGRGPDEVTLKAAGIGQPLA